MLRVFIGTCVNHQSESNVVVNCEVKYKIDVIYGHVEIRAWIELDGDKFIGMGSKKTFDGNGKLTAYNESPTDGSIV